MEVQKGKDGCDAKFGKFNRLLRRYDHTSIPPYMLQFKVNEWLKEISAVLDDLLDSIEVMSIKHGHGHDLGYEEVAVWRQKITDREKELTNIINKVV